MGEATASGCENTLPAVGGKEEARLEQISWRFAYEALTHVHSLRLFLFNDVNVLPQAGVTVRAYLLPTSPFSSSPVVVCEWKDSERRGDNHTVYVPMPFCLLDHSAPFTATVAGDHIEVKLTLLPFGGTFLDGLSFLGFSHRGVPIKRDGGERTEAQILEEAPFTLASDGQLLTKKQDLSFYCRSCSANLMKKPISCVQELPSTDWRELADNWFGNCCSSPAHAERSYAKYEKLLTPARGVCLVGTTICITHTDDLQGSVHSSHHQSTLQNENSSPGTSGINDADVKSMADLTVTTMDGNVPDNAVATLGVKDGSERTVSDADELAPSTNSDATVKNTLGHGSEGPCCHDHHGDGSAGSVEQMATFMMPGCGFMGGPTVASSNSSWTPFHCHACSSLLGVVTSGSKEGVQLFKCHISTDPSPGGASDIFRHHTLERVFCNELFANVEDNSSYRYIIRGLNSKAPLLQLVLINQESWNCSASCLGELSRLRDDVNTVSSKETNGHVKPAMLLRTESDLMVGKGKEEFLPAFLEPVAKVMFRDTSAFSPDELSEVENWAKTQQADDIFVLETVVKSLAEALHKNQGLFPVSSTAFQQFNFSFLAR